MMSIDEWKELEISRVSSFAEAFRVVDESASLGDNDWVDHYFHYLSFGEIFQPTIMEQRIP